MAEVVLYFQTPRLSTPVIERRQGDLITALMAAEGASERGLRFLAAWFPEEGVSLMPCQVCRGHGCLECDHSGYIIRLGLPLLLEALISREEEP